MKLLLDTHALLWWLSDPGILSETALDAISEPGNDVLVSAVVAWEIAIKRGLGKLTAPADLLTEIAVSGLEVLPISMEHALMTGRLPNHHRDPFDRMLVAQGND
jgi:PIN domain nuclease of toxin-antitoxin system